MHPKSLKLLDDVAEAAAFITESTESVTLTHYQANRMLRSAVERNFEIIGDALLRLAHIDEPTVTRISHYRQIIGFRNRLAHGYDAIDQALVWEIITDFLPLLRSEVGSMRREDQG